MTSNVLDVSKLSKELILQLELLKKENTDQVNRMDSQWFTGINWDEFYDLMLHHRTFSYLCPKLKGIKETLIPSYVVEKLQALYKRNTFKMLHLSAEMNNVSYTFHNNQIRTLFLKGPVLAKELYGDISLRTSNDLDVLVSIKDLDKVHEILSDDGYIKDDYIRTILGDWKWRHHHVTYFHPVKQIKLEIHWRLNPGPGKEPSFEELWSRKSVCTLTATPIYMLGKEDLLLFLLAHGARHGWSRLRWLLDIDLLLKQDMILPLLKQLFKKYQLNLLAGQAFLLVSELFGTTINDNLTDLKHKEHADKIAQQTMFYFENKINLHSEPIPNWVSQYHENYLFNLKNKRQKFIFILSFFYPYPEDQDFLPLPKHFHFLYFPLRPLIWLWKKARMRIQTLQ